MGMYIVLTVKLRQKGSAESKPLDGEIEQDEPVSPSSRSSRPHRGRPAQSRLDPA